MKLVDQTERTLVGRNEVMEEMRNHFQELNKEITKATEGKDSIISGAKDEEKADPAYTEGKSSIN